MKTTLKIVKKSAAGLMLLAFAVASFGFSSNQVAYAATTWDTTGAYVVNMNYLGTDYPHDMSLVQDGLDNLTGNGGSPAGGNTYTWVLTSGTVVNSTIDFLADYTATPDAVTPQTVLHVVGIIAPDGTISGTWSDNYAGGAREGTLSTVSGAATEENLGGEIGGEVVPGNGILQVTSIEMTDSTATANNSFEDGWEYVFNITVPTDEPDISMKFADWAKTGGGGTIPAGGNMRISSPQANNGGATVPITAANTYSTPALTMITDLNPALDGIQVKVTVEVKIPAGTPNGSYTTSYGVKSE